MKKASTVVTLLLLTLGVGAQAPQPPLPPAFRADTDLVEVDVLVRDKDGRFVSDLAIDDFDLQEDGKPYRVQQLYLRLRLATGHGWDTLRAGTGPAPSSNRASPAAGTPHVFVVVFDDGHLSPPGFKRTQAAALTLFQTHLRDGDVGGVVSNGRMANGRITSDRAELIKAVKDARPSASSAGRQLDQTMWPRVTDIEAVRIAVNDDKEIFEMVVRRACADDPSACKGPAGDEPARGSIPGKAAQIAGEVRIEATKTLTMLSSVLAGLSRLEGPKNVLLMSEGFVSEETWHEVQDAVSSAARANTRIYTLDARGLSKGMVSVESLAPAESMSRMLEQMDMGADSINSLAVDTGGFVVRNTNQFDRAIAQIADDASNYYVVGYLPPSPADGKFHRISVKVKRPGVSVRARRGYTASPRRRAVTATTAAAPTALATRATPASEATPAFEATPEAAAAPEAAAPGRAEAIVAVEVPAAPEVLADPAVVGSTLSIGGRASGSGLRLRPDASKHLDMLLADPAADRAAAAGWEAYQRGDVVTARASLSVAAASPSAEAWVHYALGMSEYALGRFAAAVGEWEKVRAAGREFEPVYFDLVDGYLQLKEHDKAIRLLREGATRWPKDPEIFNALGVVQTARGALEDASASFQDAIAAAPAESTSYFNLGTVMELRYFRTRRYVQQTKRWIANEKDRTSALEYYERYLTFGGPYAEAARAGITRLKWAVR